MQPITNYQTTDSFIRLLLQGVPGSGKTTTACRFPGCYIIDIDANLGGPLRFLQGHNLTPPLGYDRLDFDEKGNPVPIAMRYTRLNQLLVEAQKNPDIKTIVIDSATGLSDLLMAETERLQPGLKDGRQVWGFFYKYGKALLSTLTSMKKNIVLTCHEKLERNELDQTIKTKVFWPGQLGDIIAAFFTDNWQCVVKADGFPPKHKWVIRTLGDHRTDLKNSFEFPAEFEFDWALVEKKLGGGK